MGFRTEIVLIADDEAFNQVRSDWEGLSEKSHHSCFLSWGWMAAWQSVLPPEMKLYSIRLYEDDKLVAMAFVTEQILKRNYLFKSKSLALNECLLPGYDFMIEHNDFVTDKPEPAYYREMLKAINERMDWDELYLSGINAAGALNHPEYIDIQSVGKRVLKFSKSRYADLEEVRQKSDSFVASLSKKTRYKIKQYLKLFEETGEIKLHIAESAEQAQDYLTELKFHHQQHWQSRNVSGSFANELWEGFHRDLINLSFSDGGVQLCKITCGSETVGLVYCLVKDQRVYMIQSGFNYGKFKDKHPGYVCLSQLIQHNLDNNRQVFDFLAGRSQYKESISNRECTLVWIVLQRKKVKFLFENLLRHIRRKLLRLNDDVSF